jgi:hypothetical protein
MLIHAITSRDGPIQNADEPSAKIALTLTALVDVLANTLLAFRLLPFNCSNASPCAYTSRVHLRMRREPIRGVTLRPTTALAI